MDVVSLAASVAGFLSLAVEITTVLSDFISSARSAPQEAHDLAMEVAALSYVLDALVDILDGDDVRGTTFDQKSILRSVLGACYAHVAAVGKKFSKLQSSNTVTKIIGRISWPLKRDECQQSVQTLHRYV
jgi:hypothetical protein